MRGLTHRLVEERAGQAQGSVKHHFGSIEGLVEAVLNHMAAIELPRVLHPAPDASLEGVTSQAQAIMDAVYSRPDLARARFELYLHAVGRPELQAIIARARDRFVDSIAEALPGPNAEVGARFVAAVMDGLVLDQISAPHPTLSTHAGVMVAHAGLAGRRLAEGPAVSPSPSASDQTS